MLPQSEASYRSSRPELKMIGLELISALDVTECLRLLAADLGPVRDREVTGFSRRWKWSPEERVSEGDPGDWAAVARAISGRVRELGWRQRELAERSHVSVAVVRELQRHTVERRSPPHARGLVRGTRMGAGAP
jgi:hypothetical protein